jgi:hypothetical protein
VFAVISVSGTRAGTLLREYWLNVPGALVSDLTSSSNFPDNPSGSNQLATFEAPINWADTYGTRIRGYITPAISGPYVFWISSDDASELWLSPSDDPEAKILFATVPGWSNSREWTKYPAQKSAAIGLVAGQQYYVEALQKEAFGGDNVAVGWAKPGEPTTGPSEVIPGSVLSPWTGPKPGYNSRPVVTVPNGKWFAEGPLNVQLIGTAKDDGNPLPANPGNPDPNDPNKLRWNWSVVSRPAASSGVVWSGHATNGEAFTYSGSSNAPNTVFTCDPTATLDVPGLYVFQFTASDGAKQATNFVKVFVRSSGAYRTMGYNYLSPVPGAEYCSPQTRFILVRFQTISPAALTNLGQFIHVTGASSGNHPGSTKIGGDSKTVIFQMSTGFTANELVTVSLNPLTAGGGSVQPYQYQFIVSGHLPDVSSFVAPVAPPPAPPNSSNTVVHTLAVVRTNSGASGAKAMAMTMPNGVSVPSDFPRINITTNVNPDSEYIFIDNRGGNGHPYNVIFDNTGSPIWYSRYPDERRDMKVQPNGLLTMLARDTGANHFNALNTNYQQVASYYAVNGYTVDEHELQMLQDGTYFFVALRGETVDMSRYVLGGNPAASVTEQIIQQFAPNGDLIFQWRAWDKIDIRDQRTFIDITAGGFDFPHMNAIDVDKDGNILLSSRNTSEVTKINKDTGQTIWVLGGAANQFTFVNDPLQGPANQHAIRCVGTNHYTMFDNGDQHSPSVSRGVEYQLDPTNMTATVVWQYPGTPTTSLYSFYMGNAQRLPNGNTLIDWAVGNLPKLTEVRPDGSKAFEMNWVDGFEAYRTWRCTWHGVATQPYLILEPYPDNLTLIFNQFGDTNVAYYRIYGGPAPHPTTLLATSGYTLKALSNLTNGLYYFRVTAVNNSGVEGPYSNETNVTVNIIQPGQNMVSNGNFSQGTASWTFNLSGGATAAWAIESGVSHFYITNGGSSLPSVQLLQTNKAIIQGKKYVLDFDAWADAPRYIDVKVVQAASPFTDYSHITSPFITPTHNHYRYIFTMTQASDFSANLVFNLGASSIGVYLDNISLFNPPVGDFNMDTRVDYFDLSAFGAAWLKQINGLPADLDGNNKVDFKDFGIFGENWSGGIP